MCMHSMFHSYVNCANCLLVYFCIFVLYFFSFVPPELPKPVVGINFARDGMQEKDSENNCTQNINLLDVITFSLKDDFGFPVNNYVY